MLLFSRKTNNSHQKQHTAELLTRNYLDSFNKQSKYDILDFSDFRPVMTNYEDDPAMAKYDNDSLIPEKLKKGFKPQIKGWVITVIYNGKNENGKDGKHKYLIAFDSDLSKIITGIETTSVTIHI